VHNVPHPDACSCLHNMTPHRMDITLSARVSSQTDFFPNGQLFKFYVGAVRRWLHCPGAQRIALIRLLEAKPERRAPHMLSQMKRLHRAAHFKFFRSIFWAWSRFQKALLIFLFFFCLGAQIHRGGHTPSPTVAVPSARLIAGGSQRSSSLGGRVVLLN